MEMMISGEGTGAAWGPWIIRVRRRAHSDAAYFFVYSIGVTLVTQEIRSLSLELNLTLSTKMHVSFTQSF